MSSPGWVFAFPGLQPVEPAAARELVRVSPLVEAVVRACDAVVREEGGHSLLPYWLDERAVLPILDCRLCYPLALSYQLALVASLAEAGVAPAAAVGLSAGEPAAAHAAGMIGLADAMRIAFHTASGLELHQRWQRIVSIHAPVASVDALIDEDRDAVDIAIVISDQLTVVSGDALAIDRLLGRSARAGIRHTQVPFAFGAHNRWMGAMREPLLHALRGIRPRAATCRYVSATTGSWLEDPGQVGPEYWWLHASARISFREALDQLWGAGYRRFVEVGPRSLFTAELLRYGGEVCGALDLVSSCRAVEGVP